MGMIRIQGEVGDIRNTINLYRVQLIFLKLTIIINFEL